MFRKIRESRFTKVFVLILAVSILENIFYPTIVSAITTGPVQPEMAGFEPVGTTQMVDLFSGDFTYNIPLFELPGPNGGYPFNIAYHSGVTMDQEASWVGLGWSLNPGAINRTVRGFPDDFDGGNDKISTTLEMKPNITVGAEGQFAGELFGASTKKIKGSVRAKLYYNNFKGLGVGYGIGFQPSYKILSANLGLGIDSQNGADISLGAGISLKDGDSEMRFNSGLSLNSKAGLNLGLSAAFGSSNIKLKKSGGGSSISFAQRTFSPVMSHETSGMDLTASVEFGGCLFGVNGDFTISGFYMQQDVKYRNTEVEAFGYMNLNTPFENSDYNNRKYVLDYSREKESLITEKTPNLAIPSLTFDYYSISGQGISGNFRPYRSDYGHVHATNITSNAFGIAGGVDLGLPGKTGFDATFSKTKSTVGMWKDDNNLFDSYKFSKENRYADEDNEMGYEAYYMKIVGEHTALVGGIVNEYTESNRETPIRIDIEESSITKESIFSTQAVNRNSLIGEISNIYDNKRFVRSTFVLPLKNSDLSPNSGEYSLENHISDLYRSNYPQNHIGAFSVANENGNKYIYALPVYNNLKEEHLFSVDPVTSYDDVRTKGNIDQVNPSTLNTSDKYFKKTTTSKYAFSYLLTSVLGDDYIDRTRNGPSDDDYGYWVKFGYDKKNNYGWRSPYSGARYDPGSFNVAEDDKASFLYGEKDQIILSTVETKTHKAIFYSSVRNDGRGSDRFGADYKGESYQLDRIELSIKSSGQLVKTIYFEYDYSLCVGVDNNSNDSEGKLTLKRIFYKVPLSNAEINAYEFEYGNFGNEISNPVYDEFAVDRWGSYKDLGNSFTSLNRSQQEAVLHLPYVEQFPGHIYTSSSQFSSWSEYISAKETFKTNKDKSATAWHLTKITLPSGGQINVKYESDDYAYVQHREATQMFRIGGIKDFNSNTVYDKYGWKTNPNQQNSNNELTIYFDLEEPVRDRQELFQKYIAGLKRKTNLDINSTSFNDSYPVYFKVKSKLRNENSYDYVSGYAEIDMEHTSPYGVTDWFSENGELFYGRGFIRLKPITVKTKGNLTRCFHPFAVAAWQFVKENCPHLLSSSGALQFGEPTSDLDSKISKIVGIVNLFDGIEELMADFTNIASSRSIGSTIELSNSLIRLCTPDKFKYGGGVRVREITLNDGWDEMTHQTENTSVYGQVFDYTMEENGKTISSGVASYEPMVGGDENALRYAKAYAQPVPNNSDLIRYFEYPINESYYPGESVGYRQVKVWTKNSYDNFVNNNPLGTGYSIHEFYTYKEFPVRYYETDIMQKTYKKNKILPFIGGDYTNKLTASQGYSVVLNDMHGKIKKISNYSQPNVTGISNMVSGTVYDYKMKEIDFEGYKVYEPDNVVSVLVDDVTASTLTNPNITFGGQPRTPGGWDDYFLYEEKTVVDYSNFSSKYEDKMVGVTTEIFTDFNHANTTHSYGGVDVNFDIMLFAFLPLPWPCVNRSELQLRTAVTNKVINKSGILNAVTQINNSSIVKTENILFDKYTGNPLLTKTYNSFDEPIYSYSIPSHYNYKDLGPLYTSAGTVHELSRTLGSGSIITLDVRPETEVIFKNGGYFMVNGQKYRVTKSPFYNNILSYFFYGPPPINNQPLRIIELECTKNKLNEVSESITALKNPTDKILKRTSVFNKIIREGGLWENHDNVMKQCADYMNANIVPFIRDVAKFVPTHSNYRTDYVSKHFPYMHILFDYSPIPGAISLPSFGLGGVDPYNNCLCAENYTCYDPNNTNESRFNFIEDCGFHYSEESTVNRNNGSYYHTFELNTNIIAPKRRGSCDVIGYHKSFRLEPGFSDSYPTLTTAFNMIIDSGFTHVHIVQPLIRGPRELSQHDIDNNLSAINQNVPTYLSPEYEIYFTIEDADGKHISQFNEPFSIPIGYFKTKNDGGKIVSDFELNNSVYIERVEYFNPRSIQNIRLDYSEIYSSCNGGSFWQAQFSTAINGTEYKGRKVLFEYESGYNDNSAPTYTILSQKYNVLLRDVLNSEVTNYKDFTVGGQRKILPTKKYFYNDDRLSSISSNPDMNTTPNLKHDGVYANSIENNNRQFYQYLWMPNSIWNNSNKWIAHLEIEQYDVNQNVVLQKDIMNLKTSAKYGAIDNLPSIIAKGILGTEILFDDFRNNNNIDETRVQNNLWYGTKIKAFVGNSDATINAGITIQRNSNYDLVMYVKNINLMNYNFISVHDGNSFVNVPMTIEPYDRSEFYIARGRLPRFEYNRSLSMRIASGVNVASYIVSKTSNNMNFKAYSYDEQLRLSIEYDENYYPTFYTYDEKGSVAQIRKLTNEGIKTIGENRKFVKR